MNLIPPLDLTTQFQTIQDEVSTAVMQVLSSGRYINGPVVEAFEQQFAAYIGTQDCVACNSGTDALLLALRALAIGEGDEVITTPFSFFATAEVISMVHATPVFVDIDPTTFNLDLAQVEAAITPRTKAIMPVHLFGQPVDMERLMAIARAHQLWVIEDCAQSAGAEWAGAKVGSIGDIGCFSFYPTKNLGACGDGGAVTVNRPDWAQKMRSLREHGQCQQYVHDEIGVNSRLDVLQATILQIKLRYLDRWNAHRQAVADRYAERLSAIPGIAPPQVISGGLHVWNQYTVRVTPEGATTATLEQKQQFRDRLRTLLRENGVISSVYYPLPLHLQPVYQSLGYAPGQLPAVEHAAAEVLSLPMFPELMVEQQDQVIQMLKESLIQASKRVAA